MRANKYITSDLRKLKYHIGYYRLTRRFQKLDLPSLTTEEKKEIRKTWPGVTILNMDMVHAKLFKKIHGFSPYYLSPCWYNEIREKMNPKNQLYSLENKALCDIYFPQLSFPEVYLRRLNGFFFDKDMNYLSKEDAKELLASYDEFVIKPSIGTEQGQGVKKVTKESNYDLDALFSEEGLDFIAQEVLKQAPEIERLNPTSLNCFRVTTMYMENKFGYSTALKVGKKGAVRDNWNTGYWVNVNNDGKCSQYGYDYAMNPNEKTDNGIVFENLQMPNFQEMINHLEMIHKKLFPNCGVIGWDVTIDKDYKTRIIEYNLWDPGTNIEQFVCGDFFQPFRDQMLNYLRH